MRGSHPKSLFIISSNHLKETRAIYGWEELRSVEYLLVEESSAFVWISVLCEPFVSQAE